ncbi:MAG TPA: DUF4114 domain-containing protein [Opitutaceae bacterium]|nr:DUF4114 domain-containing protein [Opitutaceae bacterium]
MKKLVSLCLLLSAAYAFGQLESATGGRLDNYTSWFGDFAVCSDATYPNNPSPPHLLPAAGTPEGWLGWNQNFGSGTPLSPITNSSTDPTFRLRVEYVFLGETAGWKNNWGYRLNGSDNLIASGIQACGSTPNIKFGDFGSVLLYNGDTLDFFLQGMGSGGGKYFVVDPTQSIPASATMQSYYGLFFTSTEDTVPYTIIGFEDIRLGASGSDGDYNDFLFAFRAAKDEEQAPVPEPSTYGLFAAMLLILLAEYRRRRA